MELDHYVSEAFVRDRETRRRYEQDFIELIKIIREQLLLLGDQDQEAELEELE